MTIPDFTAKLRNAADPIERLTWHYENPAAAAMASAAGGVPVFGITSNTVPWELLRAAGAFPCVVNQGKANPADQNRVSLHALAGRLEAFVDLRLHPLEHIRALTERLQKQTNDGSFGQDLIDYLYLLDHLDYPRYEDLRQSSDMTAWILTMPSKDAAPSLARWKAGNGTAWLLAAMIRLHAGDPDLPAVINAASKIPPSSPAYATAQCHRIRLLAESGRTGEARDTLDRLLPELRSSLENSSLNLFLAERMQLASNFDEFLEYAPRIPQVNPLSAQTSYPELEEYSGPSTPLFDSDSIKILNRALPLRLLARAATGKLPLHLRKQLIRAAWTRAALISDGKTAKELSGELKRAFPELEADLKSWRDAQDSGSRQFAQAMLLMHFPGMSPFLHAGLPRRAKIEGIDSFRENWWCGFDAGELDQPTGNRYNLSSWQRDVKPPEPAEFPAFLTSADREEFMREWTKLAEVPTASDYFGKIVISWAEKHPKDERVPEALHLVVKSTRFGCTGSESGGYSRTAFRLLHSRYPDTGWAKSTPYWFR